MCKIGYSFLARTSLARVNSYNMVIFPLILLNSTSSTVVVKNEVQRQIGIGKFMSLQAQQVCVPISGLLLDNSMIFLYLV